jgi:hypothetical protein
MAQFSLQYLDEVEERFYEQTEQLSKQELVECLRELKDEEFGGDQHPAQERSRDDLEDIFFCEWPRNAEILDRALSPGGVIYRRLPNPKT